MVMRRVNAKKLKVILQGFLLLFVLIDQEEGGGVVCGRESE